ncbi:FixH family protein [Ornithinibacillus sp. FSL M8-0202]|uniref:FixH family protein n=1 Tax=Ornithinibacillus sp. FSL M8-0202 TaxID=2921616 RepID=UPI0030CD44DC
MKKYIGLLMILLVGALAACGNNNNGEKTDADEEVKAVNVDFQLPEHADVGEVVELKAIVTYGDELVKDADKVEFEYWVQGNEKETTTVEGKNNDDGTYTADVTFEADGIYEIYAHTTARMVHIMPKKSITIGEGNATAHEEHGEGHDNHDHSSHEEGFMMHFMKPGDVQVNKEINLTLHLMMNDEPLEGATVRYQINKDGTEEYEWVDADEPASGEYSGSYSFDKEGTYTIVVHVENDEDLHEHKEYTVEVK